MRPCFPVTPRDGGRLQRARNWIQSNSFATRFPVLIPNGKTTNIQTALATQPLASLGTIFLALPIPALEGIMLECDPYLCSLAALDFTRALGSQHHRPHLREKGFEAQRGEKTRPRSYQAPCSSVICVYAVTSQCVWPQCAWPRLRERPRGGAQSGAVAGISRDEVPRGRGPWPGCGKHASEKRSSGKSTGSSGWQGRWCRRRGESGSRAGQAPGRSGVSIEAGGLGKV